MVVGLIITLREGLEAALVVGIVLGVLRRLGRMDQLRVVWAGVLAAVLTSLLAGVLLNRLGIAFEGRGEQVFEGFTMLAAVAVLTWMIFWMQKQSQQIGAAIERDTAQASLQSARVLFGLSFLAVVREGLETALFLTAAAFRSDAIQTLVGGTLGLFIAVALGWMIYVGSVRLNLRVLFRVTGFLLMLFAAGLLGQGVHELQEASLLPLTIEHVWDISSVLSESSTLGSLLKALFGYDANPSLLQVIFYIAYLLIIWAVQRGHQLGRSRRTPIIGEGVAK